jgi:hypothetical protein
MRQPHAHRIHRTAKSRYHERAGRCVRCDAVDVLGHHLLSVSGAMPNVCFMIQMRQMTIPCFLAGLGTQQMLHH